MTLTLGIWSSLLPTPFLWLHCESLFSVTVTVAVTACLRNALRFVERQSKRRRWISQAEMLRNLNRTIKANERRIREREWGKEQRKRGSTTCYKDNIVKYKRNKTNILSRGWVRWKVNKYRMNLVWKGNKHKCNMPWIFIDYGLTIIGYINNLKVLLT